MHEINFGGCLLISLSFSSVSNDDEVTLWQGWLWLGWVQPMVYQILKGPLIGRFQSESKNKDHILKNDHHKIKFYYPQSKESRRKFRISFWYSSHNVTHPILFLFSLSFHLKFPYTTEKCTKKFLLVESVVGLMSESISPIRADQEYIQA